MNRIAQRGTYKISRFNYQRQEDRCHHGLPFHSLTSAATDQVVPQLTHERAGCCLSWPLCSEVHQQAATTCLRNFAGFGPHDQCLEYIGPHSCAYLLALGAMVSAIESCALHLISVDCSWCSFESSPSRHIVPHPLELSYSAEGAKR
ncbi:unnamed protein product [Ectocarpus fasciculatus]